MDKAGMIRQAEFAIAAMRELLHAHDGSAIQTMSHSITSGYRSLKKALLRYDSTTTELEELKQCLEKFHQALLKGDLFLAEYMLDRLEAVVRRLKTGEKPFYSQETLHPRDIREKNIHLQHKPVQIGQCFLHNRPRPQGTSRPSGRRI